MNKEGSISLTVLESSNPNWKELVNQLLECLDAKHTDKDLLLGKSKVLIQDKYMQILNKALEEKQK